MSRLLACFVALFLVTVSNASTADFCRGFEKGYVTGYKQAKRTSLDPLVPLCPLQPLKGLHDPDSDFEHGYLIGLKKGLAAGSQ